MAPVVHRVVVTGQLVERVNQSMMQRSNPSQPMKSPVPVRVKAIVANTKISEREMRKSFSAALSAASPKA